MKKSLFIILCFVMVLSTGCTKSKEKDNKELLATALDTQFEAVEKSTENEDVPEFLLAVEESNQYEVLSFEEEDGIMDAVVRVTAPDIYTAVKELDKKGVSSVEDMQKELKKAVQKAEKIETEVNLQFRLVDGKWSPILTDEFLDAYYGGILRLRSEYFSELMEGGGPVE